MHKRSELIFLYIPVLLLILAPLVLLTTGMDLFDEGYYLQGYARQQSIFFQYTGFHFLVRVLPFSEHIVFARVYRVVLLVLAALIFGKALHKKVFPEKTFIEVAGYVLLGNFLTYVHLASSISYNTISVIFLELLLACYLFFRSDSFSFSKRFIFPLFVFSALLGLQAFNKPTSAALLAILFTVDQAVYRLPCWKDWIGVIGIVAVVSSLVFLLLVAASFGVNVLEVFYMMQQPDNPFSEGHLSVGFMLGQLFINTVLQSKMFILFTFSYLFVYLVARRYRYVNHYLVQVVFALITLGVFYRYRNVYFGQPGAEYVFSFFLFFLIAWWLHSWQSRKTGNHKVDWHLVIAFCVLPFAGFWGSNNPPMLGIIHYMVFPLLLIIYLNRQLELSFVRFLPLMLAGYTLYNFIWAPFYNPPVFQQNKSINVHGVNMKVSDYVYDRGTAFTAIRNELNPDLPLIPVAVPNGLLYMNRLTAHFTLHFNSPEFTRGYLQLIRMKALPPSAQLLLFRDHGSSEIQDTFDNFIRYLEEHHYNITLSKETTEYRLYDFKRL